MTNKFQCMLNFSFKTIFPTLILFGILSSCVITSTTTMFSSTDYTPSGDVKVFDLKNLDFESLIGSELGEYRYSELYSKVEYVKLEATEQSSIGEISKMEVLPNGDFIIFDKKHQILARFDTNGHFLNLIGSIGKANNEYVKISDFMYDPYTNQIVVDDAHHRSLKFYNIQGEFTSDIKFDKMFHSFGIIDENHIAVNMNYGDWSKDGETVYNLHVYDRKGNLLNQYDPYNTKPKMLYDTSETFKFQNGRLICMNLYLPTIFTFEQDQIRPLYFIDFGEKQYPIEEYKNTDITTLKKSLKKSAWCNKFYETNKSYMMLISVGGNMVLYIQNKKNPKKVFIKHLAFNDLSGKIDINSFKYLQNNKIYISYDPSTIESEYKVLKENPKAFEEKRGPITPKDIEIIEDLKNHSNPIIQICTLKD